MRYIFKYRKKWFWKKMNVIGHVYESTQDKMVLYFENGGIQEISEWKKCEIKLGPDWVLAKKKMLESESGIDVKLNVEMKN